LSKEYLHWAKEHYENFTVSSFLLPRRLRQPVRLIYAYCRYVDDLGDEVPGDRQAYLQEWETDLKRCFGSTPHHPLLKDLQKVIVDFQLPQKPFFELIEANRLDQKEFRYQTFEDLLGYCRYSANPVGHLYLALWGYTDIERQNLSDFTCTALQLVNFWQDIVEDYNRGRIYIPIEDLKCFQVSEKDIAVGHMTSELRELLHFEVNRTKQLFRKGQPLLNLIDRRAKLAVSLFTTGGRSIIDAMERLDYDVFHNKIRLSKVKKMSLLLMSLADTVFSRQGGRT
jgi:squalene synthase HpnC